MTPDRLKLARTILDANLAIWTRRKLDPAHAEFRSAPLVVVLTELFPEAVEALEELAANGKPLGVADGNRVAVTVQGGTDAPVVVK